MTKGVSNMVIGRLAHVAIGAENLTENLALYRDLLGVVEVARSDETVYLSGGRRAGFDLALGAWGRGLHHFAFEVAREEDLAAAAARLEQRGVRVQTLDSSPEPGVAAGIRFVLPSGHVMELVVLESPTPFEATPQVDARHRRGIGPVVLEHLTLNVDDVRETAEFLVETLDFKLTELSRSGPASPWFVAFVRTRDLHHDLGLFHNHVASGPGLDHFGFGVRSVDDLVRAADILRGLGQFLECSPGRHIAGDNVFVYLQDRSDNRVELGTPLATIDVAAPPRIFEAAADDKGWQGVFDAWREGIPPAVRRPNPCFDGRRAAAYPP